MSEHPSIEEVFKVPNKHTCGCSDFDIEYIKKRNLRRRKYIQAFCIGEGGCGEVFKFNRKGKIISTSLVTAPVIALP